MNSRNTAIAVIGVFVLAALAVCVVSEGSDAAGVSIENVEFVEDKDRFEIQFSEVLKGYWTFEVYLDGAHVGYGEGYNPGSSVIGLHPYDGITVEEGESYRIVATYGTETLSYTYNYDTFDATATATEGGTVTGSGSYVAGHEVIFTAVAGEGYGFVGWYDGDSLVSADAEYTFWIHGQVSYKAVFKAKVFTVTFDTNGGSTVDPQKVVYGGTVTKPADPTRSSYSFDGWYSDSAPTTSFDFTTKVIDDITLYAKWTYVSLGPGPGPGPTPDPEPEEPKIPVVPDKEDGTYPYGDGSMTIETSTDGSKTVEISQPVRNGTETEVQKFDKDGKYLGSEITTETKRAVSGNIVTTKVVEIRDGSAEMTSKVTDVESVSSDGSISTVVRTVEDAKGIVSSMSETTVLADADGSISEQMVQDTLAQLKDTTSKKTEMTVNLRAAEKAGQVSAITIAPGSLRALADTGADILFGTETMVIDLDDATIGMLSGKQGDITVSIGEADRTRLNPHQLKRVGDAPVFTIDLKVGDEDIHQLGGKASVTLPYELKAGQNSKNVKVYYVDDEGKLTQMVTKYDAATKSVTFETNHFSVYMIGDESAIVDPSEDVDEDEGGLNMALVAGVIVGVVAVIAIAAVAITRMH